MIENIIMEREMPLKIKDIVENGEKFLLLGENSSEEEIFLLHSLAEFLRAKNKKVFRCPPSEEENRLNENHKTEIKIPKNFGLEGVSYEERENEFVILIESKEKIESKEQIAVAQTKIKLDGVFSFGEFNEEELKKDFILPEKEKIVLMGPISQIGRISQISQIGPIGQAGEVQLIGRALARTHFDENLYSNWTFLKAKDFEKTKTIPEPETIRDLFAKIKNFLKEAKFHFIFWETSKGNQSKILGFVSGRNEESLTFLAKSLGAQIQSDYFFTPAFSNFSEAELSARKSLKKLIQEKI